MAEESKKVDPTMFISKSPMKTGRRIPTGGIEPGSLTGRRPDFNPAPESEPGQEHRDLLRRVGSMTAEEFKTFKSSPENLKKLEMAQRYKKESRNE